MDALLDAYNNEELEEHSIKVIAYKVDKMDPNNEQQKAFVSQILSRYEPEKASDIFDLSLFSSVEVKDMYYLGKTSLQDFPQGTGTILEYSLPYPFPSSNCQCCSSVEK